MINVKNFKSYVINEAEVARTQQSESMWRIIASGAVAAFALGCIALIVIASINLSKVPSGVTNEFVDQYRRVRNPLYDHEWERFEAIWIGPLALGTVGLSFGLGGVIGCCVLYSKTHARNPIKDWKVIIGDKFAQNKIWNKRDFAALKAHMAFVKDFAFLALYLTEEETKIANQVLGAQWAPAVLKCIIAEVEKPEEKQPRAEPLFEHASVSANVR